MEEYTNRELGLLLKSLHEKMDEGFRGVHARQDRTNGNVCRNDKRIKSLENWRWYIVGGGSAILLVINIVYKFI